MVKGLDTDISAARKRRRTNLDRGSTVSQAGQLAGATLVAAAHYFAEVERIRQKASREHPLLEHTGR